VDLARCTAELREAIARGGDGVARAAIECPSAGALLARIGVDRGRLLQALSSVHAREEGARLIAEAAREAGALGEAEVAPLHLLLALTQSPGEAGAALRAAGATRGKLLAALAGPARATPVLDRFSRDLNQLARSGRLDPMVGREPELARVIHVLGRRTKRNPVLLGDPGVGKTAIVEGLAARLAAGDVPGHLAGARLVELELGALVAGARWRGDFEERVRAILRELAVATEVIVFIDEIHLMCVAGGGQGAIEAAGLLKPALARGELRCIGATTVEEWRRVIERDGALERRLLPVRVEEPSREEAERMIRALRPRYEEHHRLVLPDQAIAAAVRMTARHVAGRALPDKAIDALDEAAARARAALDGGAAAEVDEAAVAAVVAEWTGVPAGRFAEGERARAAWLGDRLGRRVVGQAEAVARVARTVQRARAGLGDPSRPAASFLFVGPTGAGKTLLAQALAAELFDDERALVRVDMSEYGERHAAARLVGAPPGYVGFDEGGQLTEAVRRRPFAVVLLDEIDKAHPDVHPLLLQLLDEGRLTDGRGRTVSFRDAIVVLTANLAGVAEARQRIRRELFARLDEVVGFAPLGPEALAEVAAISLTEVQKRLELQGIWLDIGSAVALRVARIGFDRELGARPIRRAVERLVAEPIAERILGGSIRAGDRVRVYVIGEELELEVVRSAAA
jgi:ATP-dependent Clp protease ATP-binding subunit ClpA